MEASSAAARVILSLIHILLVDTIRCFQLRPQVRSLQIGHQIAGANIAPGIFIDLTTEELAAVSALFTDDLGSCLLYTSRCV